MRILIDDGMQIKVGTGIGKYSLYLYKELKKHLEKKDSVELLQFDKGSSSKKQGRLNPLYSTDYSFRDIYMIATAAENDERS